MEHLMDYCLTHLMVGTLAMPGKDDFGKEKSSRRPLLLDVTMEDCPRASSCRLLQLPTEILADIVDFIAEDKLTLASLARVNSDCRQLARSCQFSDVCFNYSPGAHKLVLKLVEEASQRQNGLRQPTIGACIRKITLRSDPGWIAAIHHELYDAVFGSPGSCTQERLMELRSAARPRYFDTYRANLVAAISAGAMPHLETVAWLDRICIDAHILSVLAHSPIQHLKLFRTPIDKACLMEPPLTPPTIPLRSLSLDVRRTYKDIALEEPKDSKHSEEPSSAAKGLPSFVSTLLRRCAPTLESLVWNNMLAICEETLSFGDDPISFPCLRYLNLRYLQLDDGARLLPLLNAPLRHFQMPLSPGRNGLERLLPSCPTLRDLETFVAPGIRPGLNQQDGNTAQEFVDFLRRHPQLRKLCVEQSWAEGLDEQLIPSLCDGTFSNLSSLSLSWAGPGLEDETRPHIATVSEASIAAIGTLTSLEQLRLAAGVESGWRHQWLVDHDMLRNKLKGLVRLKRLALSRDTYRALAIDLIEVESYYEARLVGAQDRADARTRPEYDVYEDGTKSFGGVGVGFGDNDGLGADLGLTDDPVAWERAHRNRMLDQAEAYAAVIPSLEWVYCGQWPMDIIKLEEGMERMVAPLTRERDTCYPLLGRMFGMGEDDD